MLEMNWIMLFALPSDVVYALCGFGLNHVVLAIKQYVPVTRICDLCGSSLRFALATPRSSHLFVVFLTPPISLGGPSKQLNPHFHGSPTLPILCPDYPARPTREHPAPRTRGQGASAPAARAGPARGSPGRAGRPGRTAAPRHGARPARGKGRPKRRDGPTSPAATCPAGPRVQAKRTGTGGPRKSQGRAASRNPQGTSGAQGPTGRANSHTPGPGPPPKRRAGPRAPRLSPTPAGPRRRLGAADGPRAAGPRAAAGPPPCPAPPPSAPRARAQPSAPQGPPVRQSALPAPAGERPPPSAAARSPPSLPLASAPPGRLRAQRPRGSPRAPPGPRRREELPPDGPRRRPRGHPPGPRTESTPRAETPAGPPSGAPSRRPWQPAGHPRSSRAPAGDKRSQRRIREPKGKEHTNRRTPRQWTRPGKGNCAQPIPRRATLSSLRDTGRLTNSPPVTDATRLQSASEDRPACHRNRRKKRRRRATSRDTSPKRDPPQGNRETARLPPSSHSVQPLYY
ncbi:basic proline-rich protein-like [Penaeus indicus]|uniref:basic proline-rich protein-like n=1 Tax=Penaeus indicus TaxID=29960 RepID=UPI00300D0B6A